MLRKIGLPCVLLVLLWSCKPVLTDNGTDDSTLSAKTITKFSFASLVARVTIDGLTITAAVPPGANIASLVATFTAPAATLSVGGTPQVSGVTPNDFTNPVKYLVTAGDGSTQQYTVTVTQAGIAQWAQSPSVAPGDTEFLAVAVDASGNIYAAGYQYGSGSYTYGSSVTISGAYEYGNNAVLVKYSPSGTALWARVATSGAANDSSFNGVAVDSSGNVYVVGSQSGTASYDYGSGVAAAGVSSVANAVIVKYNSSGTAQWANSVSSASNYSHFNAVALDSSGGVYAAGEVNNYNSSNTQIANWVCSYTFSGSSGTSVTLAGSTSNSGGPNATVVKYDSLGQVNWGWTVTNGTAVSSFLGIAWDAYGSSVCAAGYQYGVGPNTYGSAGSLSGVSTTANSLLVDLSPGGNGAGDGTVQWATLPSAAPGNSRFYSVATDASGNFYASGYQNGTGDYTWSGVAGTSITATGTSSSDNPVLVKFNYIGKALWARTLVAGSGQASFNSVAVDSLGNAFVVGNQNGTTAYGYSTGVTATGVYNGNNVVLVKYDSAGTAQWAQSILTAGINESRFSGVGVDSAGSVFAVGRQGQGTYTYGTGVTAFGVFGSDGYYGPTGTDAVLVKY